MAGTRHVALLRGINVGGKNKLPMAKLRALVEACGGEDVSTFIASGNAIFTATPAVANALTAKLQAAIDKEMKLHVPVVVRSHAELAKVVKDNPYAKRGIDPELTYVMFLAHKPSAKVIAALDPDRSPGDAFEVIGGEIYMHLPNGIGRSKLTNAYFDGALETMGTFRNWRTVLKLLELTGS